MGRISCYMAVLLTIFLLAAPLLSASGGATWPKIMKLDKGLQEKSLEARGLHPIEKPSPEYRKGVVLAKFKEEYKGMNINALLSSNGIEGVYQVKMFKTTGISVLKTPEGREKEVIGMLLRKGLVYYAEPDYVVKVLGVPNDPSFSSQWGLLDIDAPDAWNITTGSSNVVVAVIDTGVDYTHEDLQNNMWKNPGEIPNNGIDDDGNGYVDDVYGIDTYNGDTDPMDDHGHGTHCAGIIGAEGNNSVGIAGVNWHVKIMALKFIGADGWGYTSGAIEALEYVMMMKSSYGVNVKVTSNSWGSYWYSRALYDAIKRAGDNGILFVAAAGNSGADSDNKYPLYPAAYNLPNIISVGASDQSDMKAWFSNYGWESVDLYAPGVDILSTVPGNGYESWSGTSMATPHVAGVAALLLSQPAKANFNPIQLKFNIMFTTDPMSGFAPSVTGGRLNAYKAVSASPSDTQLRILVLSMSSKGEGYMPEATIGQNVVIKAMVGTVAGPVSSATVTATIGGDVVTLHDDGLPPDDYSRDGIYSGVYKANAAGSFPVTISASASGYSGASSTVGTLEVTAFNRYEIGETQYKWIEIKDKGYRLDLGDDGGALIVPSFDVKFYGTPYRYLMVSSNGYIAFDDTPAFIYRNTRTGYFWGSMLQAFWMDLITYPDVSDPNSNVFVAEVGSPPNRALVVEWNDVRPYPYWDLPYSVTFEVVFYENSSNIDVFYKDVVFFNDYWDEGPDYGGLATIGIQYSTYPSAVFTGYSFKKPVLRNGMGLRFSFKPMLYFDMGTSTSPVAPGFTAVTESTTTAVGKWYGWDRALRGSRDRGTADPLTRDFVFDSNDATFSVSLPNNIYTVYVVIGDANYPHDNIDIYIEGVLKADDVSVAAGQFKVLKFLVWVNDGELDITFHDDGGSDPYWVVNGIYITEGARLDFGTPTSPVDPYSIGASTEKYTPLLGYGWLSDYQIISRDRGISDSILRDLVASKYARTFRLQGPYYRYTIFSMHYDIFEHEFSVGQWGGGWDYIEIQPGELGCHLSYLYGYPEFRIADGFGPDPYWVVNFIHVRLSGW